MPTTKTGHCNSVCIVISETKDHDEVMFVNTDDDDNTRSGTR